MTSCFVCDKEVSDEIYLTSSKTFFTKTIFVTKISQVVGDDFVVVAAEEDQLCKRCATLINNSDKLEVDLMEMHNTIKKFLDLKYDLIPKEGKWTESEIEYSRSENEPNSFEFEDLPLRQTGLSFSDAEDTTYLSQASDSNLNKHPLIGESKIKTETKSGLFEEANIKLKEEPCMVPTQNCLSKENVTEEIQLEHYGGEELYSLIPDQIDNKNGMIANEEFNSSLSNENLESNKEKISKTSNKTIKINSKKEFNETFKIIKKKLILPKIVKSSDILKLASLGVFESIGPKCENNLTVDQSIQEQNEILKNLDSSSTIIKKSNCDIGDQKKDCYNKFQCDICEKECSSKNRLDVHKTIHEQKICDFCGRGFKSNYRLKVHRNIHTRQKMFTCNICGKTFIHHSTYWYHCKWHNEPYPFSCEFCGKLFKHSSILAIHRRKHTGERPYKCSYCPLTFTVSTTMKKHEMLHTKEYAFNCNVCSKGFTSRDKHMHHMARAHNVLDVRKQRKICGRMKSSEKQISPPKVNNNLELVGIDSSYIPLTLQERIKVALESEGMMKFKDISIEVINKDNLQFKNGDKEVNEHINADHGENQFLNEDQNIPIDLGENVVEIVLGPDECVYSEEVIS